MLKELFNRSINDKLCNLCDRSSIWTRYTRGIESILRNNPNIDLDYLDEMGMTALHYAIFNKYHRATKILLKYGANGSKKDRKDLTPIDYCLKLYRNGHKRSAKRILLLLIKNGAKANILTLKSIISHFGYDSDIITNLLHQERSKANLGAMVDVNILKNASESRNIPKKVIKLLLSLTSNLKIKEKTARNYDLKRYEVENNGIDLSQILENPTLKSRVQEENSFFTKEIVEKLEKNLAK